MQSICLLAVKHLGFLFSHLYSSLSSWNLKFLPRGYYMRIVAAFFPNQEVTNSVIEIEDDQITAIAISHLDKSNKLSSSVLAVDVSTKALPYFHRILIDKLYKHQLVATILANNILKQKFLDHT